LSSETTSALLQPSSSLLSLALCILALAGESDEAGISAADLVTAARTLAIEEAAAAAQTEALRLKLVFNMRLLSIEHADPTQRQRSSTASLLCLSVVEAKRV
ncbi:MAG TPA: hypothetical protein VNY55_12070, partial [Mycobacterium sp.]|nr:hypothetical protein [Mycobacterium sp.]